MLPLIFMGVEMLLFDNSVLKMYLLNTQLTLHINSFHLVYLNLLQKTICQKYMIKRLIYDLFQISLGIIPRPPYQPEKLVVYIIHTLNRAPSNSWKILNEGVKALFV